MAKEPKLFGLRNWLNGKRVTNSLLEFSDLWRICLIAVGTRTIKSVDEEEQPIRTLTPYRYDLLHITEVEGLFPTQTELQRVGTYLEQHGWAKLTSKVPVKLHLTPSGTEEANRIYDEMLGIKILVDESPNRDVNLDGEADKKIEIDIPATDRFVQLNDNSPDYALAVAELENLIRETHDVRVNDWPEKDGVIESINSTLRMIKSKYVNKAAVLAAITSATFFILKKFADAPISEMANRAWAAVKALF